MLRSAGYDQAFTSVGDKKPSLHRIKHLRIDGKPSVYSTVKPIKIYKHVNMKKYDEGNGQVRNGELGIRRSGKTATYVEWHHWPSFTLRFDRKIWWLWRTLTELLKSARWPRPRRLAPRPRHWVPRPRRPRPRARIPASTVSLNKLSYSCSAFCWQL